MPTTPLHIACAAGFSGDRTDAAPALVAELIAAKKAAPIGACLMFETLAERTLALAHIARRSNPSAGFEPLLPECIASVLGDCLRHGIAIVGNFGAANPQAAADCIAAIAREQGMPPPRIAVVWGDDLSDWAKNNAAFHINDEEITQPIVSANAYLGARAICDALQAGAQIVVAGRVADPALALGAAMAHFGWSWQDWDRMAAATMAGHLLECGAQVTGGYFADPGLKDVPDLAQLGYPIAILENDGSCTITKPANTGGMVTLATVKEQLLYELHDPAAYYTPDVTADIRWVELKEIAPNCVQMRGVRGRAHNGHYKINIFRESGWLAEGEISYAGPRALLRAQLAADIVRKRLGNPTDLRVDFIGAASVLGDDAGSWQGMELEKNQPFIHTDIRLRMAWRRANSSQAQQLLREITALYTCGPAGGCGVRGQLRSNVSQQSGLLPQASIASGWRWSHAPAPEVAPIHAQWVEMPAAAYQGADLGPKWLYDPSASKGMKGYSAAIQSKQHTVALWQLAHSRTGDKGNCSNISIIAHNAACWQLLREQLSAQRIYEHFAARQPERVQLFELPNLQAFNCVIDGVLDGGVNAALNLDAHGKSLSFWLLELPIAVPDLAWPMGDAALKSF